MRFPFVVLEGLDGTGKTTITEAVARNLSSKGTPAIAVHTPTEPYSQLAPFVIDRANLEARFHFFLSSVLYASAHIQSLITSSAVICDRYIYSTLAYHRAEGIRLDLKIEELNLILPNYLFLLTLRDDKERRRRINTRGMSPADQKSLDDPDLALRIKLEFDRFDYTPIETDEGDVELIAEKMCSVILS